MKIELNFFGRTITFLLLFFLVNQAYAQDKKESDPDDVIPLDTKVKIGRLANGFTYYIRKGDNQDNKVTIYFVVKAGRNQEDKDQVELSHLLEHMPFTGTVHFPNVYDHFAKVGVQRGTQINAFTGFDRTVYYLNDIPSDMKVVYDGLQFFRDCAHGMLLDTDRVNSARPSIVEEGRSAMAGQVSDNYLEKMIGNPGYKYRSARELIESIKNFNYESIVQFYEDWYRPNLQGIIVVGDVEQTKTEEVIKSLFSDLKNPSDQRELKKYPAFNWRNQYLPVPTRDLKSMAIDVTMKFPFHLPKTLEDFKKHALMELYQEMMSSRLAERNNQEARPDKMFICRYDKEFSGSPVGFTLLSMYAETKQAEIKDDFQALMWELERVKQHGFTEYEFEKMKQRVVEGKKLKPISTLYSEYSTSSQIAQGLVQHFVTGEVSPSFEYWEKILGTITLNEMNSFSRLLLKNSNNRDIMIFAPEKDIPTLPSEDTFLKWIREVESMTTIPYKPEIKIEVKKDSIMSFEELKKLSSKLKFERTTISGLGVTKLNLPNGIQVLLKPVKNPGDERIYLEGFKPGGSNAYQGEDYFSAIWSAALIRQSSLASYTKTELENFKNAHGVNVRPRIGRQYAFIGGTSLKKNLETGLQLLHQYMVNPSKEQKALDELVTILKKNQTEELENIGKIDLDRAYAIYRDQFGNPKDFVFVLTGDFDLEMVIPLIVKYLGNLSSPTKNEVMPAPATNISAQGVDISENEPKMTVDSTRTGYIGGVRVRFAGTSKYSDENFIKLNTLRGVLNNVLTKRLREVEGGTYNVSVDFNYVKLKGQYSFLIFFECDPNRMKEMITKAQDEIDKLVSRDIDSRILETVIGYEMSLHKKNMGKADFWMNYLIDRLQHDGDIYEITKRETTLRSLTNEDIQKAAQECLKVR
jgi:zinc protease